MQDVKNAVAAQKDFVVKLRRDLHQIPETAFTEEKTSAYVTRVLEKLGLPVTTGIARFGVVAQLDTGRSGPVLMIRADMDALPIAEDTGLAFTSRHPGVMHACGHDAHMAMALGAAAALVQLRESLRGTVKFVFQPAEEGPGGAQPMIEAGVMENPKVDYAFGCHVWPDIPAGCIGVREGPLLASMGRFDLKIIGQGGHGAMPHQCVDALEIGCQVVSALQRIVSRQMNPLTPTVVTVGSFHAGSAFNIIAPEADLCGTLRTFERDIWQSWPQRLEKIIGGVCSAMGATYNLKLSPGYPPTINDADMAAVVRTCARETVGPQKVVEPSPTMGGEDMSFFLEKAKGCFFCLGTGYRGGAPIHNAHFDFHEDMLGIGVEIYCRTALKLLARTEL